MFKLIKNLKWYDALLAFLLAVLVVLSVYLELLLPDYMKEITVLINTNNIEIKEVWIAGAKMLGCAVGGTALTIISGFISAYISADLSYFTREKLFNHVTDLDSTTIKDFSTASLITRTTNDITQLQFMVSMGLQMLIKAPVLAVWAVIKIFGKSYELSIATAIGVLVLVIFILVMLFLVFPRFKIVQKLIDELNRIARENLTGLRVVRAFNADKYMEDKFDEKNTKLIQIQNFNRNLFSLMQPLMGLVMSGLALTTYWLGAYLINKAGLFDKASVYGDIIVFGSYSTYVIMAFLYLSFVFMLIPRAQVSAARINEVLDSKVKITSGNNTLVNEVGTIKFDNVSYHYSDGNDVLKNISFEAKQGEVVAFIGSTGCGKSTLVGLASRIYDATNGSITIDGVNIKDLSFDALYNKVGYIPQKTVLFSGTVRSNIAFGSTANNITDEDILKALDISQASEFVNSLPDKLDSVIAEGGTNLSGGQKQRLAIARTIARKPEILIFDDSFSALDYKTDKELRNRIKTDLAGTTCLIVAQRIGTIKNADKIIVLDKGEIKGIGTHSELLKSCDVYYEIASSQLSESEIKGGMR